MKTEEDKPRYAEINMRLGLRPDEATFGDIGIPTDRPLKFSSDPIESDVPLKMIVVHSVAELKMMVGMPDDCDDKHISYPSSLAEISALSLEAQSDIKSAALAYVSGNSNKVKEYEHIINATLFPMQVAVFAAHDWVVQGSIVFKGPCPIVCNFNTITFDQNATLEVLTDLMLNCNDMMGPGDSAIHIDVKGEKGQNGASGLGGTKAQTDAQSEGAPGVPGETGGDGGENPVVTIVAEKLSAHIIIRAGGGNGGDGGEGGDGESVGNDRPGGEGGRGGDGGKGGNGSLVRVCYNGGSVEGQHINGAGGRHGRGGKGGTGTPKGADGSDGSDGIDGTPTIFDFQTPFQADV